MNYERFEQLPVWQAAIDLAAAVYALTEIRPFAGDTRCGTRLNGRQSQFPTISPRGLSGEQSRNCSRFFISRAARRGK